MSVTDVVVQETDQQARKARIVNDFAIQVATVNGSGSQTANLVLLRSIFQMGVPVGGKNMFPSNIAGLPTWYTIRASHQGYVGRKKEVDFLVAINPETAREDVLNLAPGAVALYDEALRRKPGEALLHFNRAVALEDQGRPMEALAAYNLSLQLAPDLADAHYNAARLHEQLGDAQNAVRHFSAYRRLERRR